MKVSIHAPTRGATSTSLAASAHIFLFQSTLPHGERLGHVLLACCIKLFQSTLPHGERQMLSGSTARTSGFNPRSHTGSDSSTRTPASAVWRFNPRSHTGSDSVAAVDGVGQADVSIHAPTRGATSSARRLRPIERFQSTLPHGERPYAYNTYDYKACMMLFLRKIYFVCHIPKKHIAILIKDSKSIHAKEE